MLVGLDVQALTVFSPPSLPDSLVERSRGGGGLPGGRRLGVRLARVFRHDDDTENQMLVSFIRLATPGWGRAEPLSSAVIGLLGWTPGAIGGLGADMFSHCCPRTPSLRWVPVSPYTHSRLLPDV